MDTTGQKKNNPGRIARLVKRSTMMGRRAWAYWNDGIWTDTRTSWWVNILKTINISIKSFLNTDLQSQACAMTYRTTLALVPALAMLFAIGRGFGFQTLLQDELFIIFPTQHEVVEQVLSFVDSYLNQSSEGIFVGIGLVFLLWTVISLLISVENTFNLIWGVTQGRSLWRKITDYTAMLLILPVLMICGAGITVFLSSSLQSMMHFSFMTPVVNMLLEGASWIVTWLFFCGVFMLIPNTKVRFGNALVAGIITGTGFKVLQWLFVTGQLYVTKYNAIYGSFSFIPLMLLWIQLTWMIILIGALVCYSSQNIFLYAFSTQVSDISLSYRRRVSTAVCTMIVKDFEEGSPALTATEITSRSDIPPRLLSDVLHKLLRAGLIVKVAVDAKNEEFGYQPSMPPDRMTYGLLRRRLDSLGRGGFIPNFSKRFSPVIAECSKVDDAANTLADAMLLKDITLEDLKTTP